mmetsp:Transcript_62772/g.177045  ORF Transcript_62772/g.177045 Transcript_62772/m.177045 type:complete len:267 (+) Transcript_62772:597-1397(+)
MKSTRTRALNISRMMKSSPFFSFSLKQVKSTGMPSRSSSSRVSSQCLTRGSASVPTPLLKHTAKLGGGSARSRASSWPLRQTPRAKTRPLPPSAGTALPRPSISGPTRTSSHWSSGNTSARRHQLPSSASCPSIMSRAPTIQTTTGLLRGGGGADAGSCSSDQTTAAGKQFVSRNRCAAGLPGAMPTASPRVSQPPSTADAIGPGLPQCPPRPSAALLCGSSVAATGDGVAVLPPARDSVNFVASLAPSLKSIGTASGSHALAWVP